MSDREPIKWQLRDSAICLLDQTLSFVAGQSIDGRKPLAGDIVRLSLKIVSLLETARLANLVSEMNFSLVKSEFLIFIESLQQSFSSLKSKADLSKGFFDTGSSLGSQVFETASNLSGRSMAPIGGPESSKEHKGQNYIKDSPLKNQLKSEAIKKDKTEKKDNRRALIMESLRRKSPLGIKDIALVVKSCSEKTIQRELVEMLSSGLVTREGERRWSRYSLI